MTEILYHIIEESQDSILIQLDQNHEIFRAHFPGNPILPGACVMAIAKELLCHKQHKSYNIKHVKIVKFLQTIDPRANDTLRFIFEKLDTNSNTMEARIAITSNDNKILFSKITMTCCDARL